MGRKDYSNNNYNKDKQNKSKKMYSIFNGVFNLKYFPLIKLKSIKLFIKDYFLLKYADAQ